MTSKGSLQAGTPRRLAELRSARLRLRSTAVRVVRARCLDDAARTGRPIELDILTDLDEALLSAAWGTGKARSRLLSAAPMSSVVDPAKLDLQAKLLAAIECLPDRVSEIYAAVSKAGYPGGKTSARKYVDNYRNQITQPGRSHARGNDLLFDRRDHWKGVLAELLPEGLDLGTFFQAL